MAPWRARHRSGTRGILTGALRYPPCRQRMGAPPPRWRVPAMPRLISSGSPPDEGRGAVMRADPAGEPLPAGQSMALSPGALEIRGLSPGDHEAYCAFATRLDQEDLRLRF